MVDTSYGNLTVRRKLFLKDRGSAVIIQSAGKPDVEGTAMRGRINKSVLTNVNDYVGKALWGVSVDVKVGDVIYFKDPKLPEFGKKRTVYEAFKHSIDGNSTPGCRVIVDG